MIKTKKILVHVCCAACANYVFSDLQKDNFEIIAFFYNPNIQGKSEYDRRLLDVQNFCQSKDIKLIIPEYDEEEFFAPLRPFGDKHSIKYISVKDRYRRKRCELCLGLLVNATLSEAKKQKIKSFTTSMLCSPYKDHNLIWDIGVQSAGNISMNFYYKDFRKGYWSGRNFARNHDMVIPAFCGCRDSLDEGRLE